MIYFATLQKNEIGKIGCQDVADRSFVAVRLGDCDIPAGQKCSPHSKSSIRHYRMIGLAQQGKIYAWKCKMVINRYKDTIYTAHR